MPREQMKIHTNALTSLCLIALSVDASAQGAVRDSAGIRIRSIVAAPQAQQISLAAAPAFDIGLEGGPYEFDRIRAIAVRSDGSIAVANGGSLEIRIFDRNGKFIRTLGRKGAGPGEFSSLSRMSVFADDSLIAADDLARRYVLFAPSGAHVRTTTLAPPAGRRGPDFIDVLANGTVLAGSLDIENVPPRAESYYFTQHLFTTNSAGEPVANLGEFGVGEFFAQRTDPSRGGMAYWDLAYGRKNTVAALSNRIAAGDGTGFEVKLYSASGKLEEILRAGEARVPVTDADKERYRRGTVSPSSTGLNRKISEDRAREMPFPREFPSFRKFFVARDGRIWIQRYPTAPDARDRWMVVEADGKLFGEIAMPSRFSPMHASRDRLVGVFTDADGVQHVQAIPIVARR